MKTSISLEDKKQVETQLKTFETNTGCELLIVVANSSDPYPAAPLRFGMTSGFLISLVFSYYFEFHHSMLWPMSFLIITLFMCWVGHFSWAKKLALSSWEVERECQEKALELFHTLGTSKVSHKVTAMIMVSVLEHQIEVLVDEKLRSKLNPSDLKELISVMRSHFGRGQMASGLILSIEAFEKKILNSFNGKVSDVSPTELSDTIHFIEN